MQGVFFLEHVLRKRHVHVLPQATFAVNADQGMQAHTRERAAPRAALLSKCTRPYSTPQVSRDKQAQCTEARKRIPHKRLEKHPYEPHQLPSKSGSTRKAWTTTGEKAGSERAGATCRYASTHMREGCTKSSTPVKVHTTILNPDR